MVGEIESFATDAVYIFVYCVNIGERVPSDNIMLDNVTSACGCLVIIIVYVIDNDIVLLVTTIVIMFSPTFNNDDVTGDPDVTVVVVSFMTIVTSDDDVSVAVGVIIIEDKVLTTDAV